jgi:hypothetical protein
VSGWTGRQAGRQAGNTQGVGQAPLQEGKYASRAVRPTTVARRTSITRMPASFARSCSSPKATMGLTMAP